jgi:DNA-binding HxlR family transcriptional regulator
MISNEDLRRLLQGRWLVPLMAEVGAARGSRFADMLLQLGLSRGALTASLALLQETGWLRRNSGHGHPLRPEYVLTDAGAPIAAFCMGIVAQRRRLGLDGHHLSRWSLPVVARLDAAQARFSALQAALRPVTPRALSLALKQMLSVDLVSRVLADDFPPIAIYGLTPRGQDLAAALR